VVVSDHDHHGRLRRPVPNVAGRPRRAVALMVAGIAMFGVITATIAAYFVEEGRGGSGLPPRPSREETRRIELG
jgi:hypothetical protein